MTDQATCHLCGQLDQLDRLEDAVGREPRTGGIGRPLRVWVHPECFEKKQAGRSDRYLALNGPLPWPGMPGWIGGRRFDKQK